MKDSPEKTQDPGELQSQPGTSKWLMLSSLRQKYYTAWKSFQGIPRGMNRGSYNKQERMMGK